MVVEGLKFQRGKGRGYSRREGLGGWVGRRIYCGIQKQETATWSGTCISSKLASKQAGTQALNPTLNL